MVLESSPASSRKARQADKRRRIIEASVAVFADKGFYGARISDVAEVAGVADGTIYLYFKSKDDLMISVFREKMGEILQRFSILRDIDDPVEKLRRYISEHLALVEEQPKLMQVLTVELRQSARFMRMNPPAAFGRYLALLAGIIDRGQKRGVFRAGLDPAVAARALFGAVDEISLSWVLASEEEAERLDRAQIAEQLTDFVLDGLRGAKNLG
jgi:TetR/AcrR family fatty acid metabolism transcriptional regulator